VFALLAPRFWANHLLAIVLVAAAVWLGLWQYHGWESRRAAEAQDLTQVTPVALDAAIGPDDPFDGRRVGRPVEVSGTWADGPTLYVSGREHDGRDGYWVVGAVLTGDGSLLPVVRGWSADPGGVPAVSGETAFVGWLQPPEGTGARDDDPSDDVLPQLRVADLAQRYDQDLYGAYAVVARADPPGWAAWPAGARAVNDGSDRLAPADLQQLPDASRFTALRNLLYAIEWWFFAAFAVLVWWRWARETAAPPVEERTEEPLPGTG
jgi:surfeit locus 1 family protein